MEAPWMESIDIAVQCDTCGEVYGVPTTVVAASQLLVEEGCPMRSPEACPAGFFSRLVDPDALEELRRAWLHLERSAAQHGALGPVVRAPKPLRRPPTRAERREQLERQAALARWHDDGGR